MGGVLGSTRRPGALLALNLAALTSACPRGAALAGICRVLRGWPASGMLYARLWLCVWPAWGASLGLHSVYSQPAAGSSARCLLVKS